MIAKKSQDMKKPTVKTLVKSSFWYTLSSFLPRTVAFITIPLFARFLTNGEFGDFGVYTSWQSVLGIICGLEIHTTLNRARLDFTEKKEFDEYVSSSLVLCVAITGAFLLLYILFPHILDGLFLLDKKIIFFMFAHVMTYPAFAVFHARERINYRYKFSATSAMILLFVSTGLSLMLVIMSKTDRLFARIVGQHILYIVAGFVLFGYFLCIGKSVKPRYWKYALRIGLPMVFSHLAGQVLLAADALVAKHMCSDDAVSYLTLVHSISRIVLVFVQTLNTAWAPWLYDMLKDKKEERIRKTFIGYLGIVMFCTFCCLLFGPEIIHILGGEKYAEAIKALPPYCLCGIFTVFTTQFTNLEIYYKKPEYSAILTSITALINVILNIIAVKIWGYLAVCYVTVLCQVLLIIMHYKVTQTMQVESILSPKTLWFSLCLSIALIPASLGLYTSNILRYAFACTVVVFIIAFVIIKRTQIKDLISLLRKRESTAEE